MTVTMTFDIFGHRKEIEVERVYHYDTIISGRPRLMVVRPSGTCTSFPDDDGSFMTEYLRLCKESNQEPRTEKPIPSYSKDREIGLAKIKADATELLSERGVGDITVEEIDGLLQRCWDWTVNHRRGDLFGSIQTLTTLRPLM